MTVRIVGLGSLGVPLAGAFAATGPTVGGVDVDPARYRTARHPTTEVNERGGASTNGWGGPCGAFVLWPPLLIRKVATTAASASTTSGAR